MALLIVSVSGQETNYQVVVVDYRELRLVPEDFSILTNSYPIFNRVHLSKISDTLGKEIKEPNIHLVVSDGFFDIYFVQL